MFPEKAAAVAWGSSIGLSCRDSAPSSFTFDWLHT